MRVTGQLMKTIDAIDIEELTSDSLLNGKLGVVYYYLNLFKIFKNEDYLKKVKSYLEIVFTNIEIGDSSLLYDSTLENGLSGLGYVLQQLLNDEVLDADFKSEIEEINSIVVEDAIKMLQNENYDFVRGPFGILLYLNFVSAREQIDRILELLITKFKNIKNFIFYNNNDYIEGVHIGYAHGLCAIIKILNDITDSRAEYMVKDLLSKITLILKDNEHCTVHGKKYYLPRSIHKSNTYKKGLNYRAVLAWSNSDVNFATLILSLEDKFITEELLKISDRIGLGSLDKIETEHTRVWDHRFYFGSSGVLKMYNFLYSKTGNPKYKEASNFWYEKTIDFVYDNSIKEHPLNFLNNLPATTLSLLEFELEKEANWSKILLL